MAPVTVDIGAINGYYNTGNHGWSALSLVAYSTHIQQLISSTGAVFGGATSTARRGQSFTPSTTFSIGAIRVPLSKNGAPVDDVTITIHTDNSLKPSSTVLGTSEAINGAKLTTTPAWQEFTFTTPVEVTASTKFWFVLQRSGAIDATNYYSTRIQSGETYTGGGNSIYDSSTLQWVSEVALNDLAFQILSSPPAALYQVTQDTSLHVWKSTDNGATWTEQHSAGAPSVVNATYPFTATDTRTGPYLITFRMTGTNAAAVRIFNMSTDTWDAADYGSSGAPTSVANTKSFRVVNENGHVTNSPGTIHVAFVDSADDADVAQQRVTGASNAWVGKVGVLAATSTERATLSEFVTDRANTGYGHRFYYDAAGDDFFTRSIYTGSTLGTQTAISIVAADSDTEHASAVYQPYDVSGTTTVIAAFIDAAGTLQERILSLDATSASITMAADNAVSAVTSFAGRQLWTGQYNGTNYIVGCTGTQILYFTSTVAGTWVAEAAWKTGLTNAVLSQARAIPNVGIIVSYTENGNTVTDWLIGPPASSTPIAATDSHVLVGDDVSSVEKTEPKTATDTHALVGDDTATVDFTFETKVDTHVLVGTDAATLSTEQSVSDTHVLVGTDASSVVKTEQYAVADTHTITGADTAVLAATSALSDTHVLLGTDAASLDIATTLTDTSTLTGTDTASLVTAVSVSDTHTILGTEVSSLLQTNAVSLSDTHALTGTDAAVLLATSTATDTTAVLGADISALAATDTRSDTTLLESDDTGTVTVAVTVSDSHTLTGVDTSSVDESFTFAAGTDTHVIASSEAVILDVSTAVSDNQLIIGTETGVSTSDTPQTDTNTIDGDDVATIHVTVVAFDSGVLVGTDASSIASIQPKSATDTGSVAGTEASALAVAAPNADDATLTGIELALLQATSSGSDQLDLTLLETALVYVDAAPVSDTAVLTCVDSASVQVLVSVTDESILAGVGSGTKTIPVGPQGYLKAHASFGSPVHVGGTATSPLSLRLERQLLSSTRADRAGPLTTKQESQ